MSREGSPDETTAPREFAEGLTFSQLAPGPLAAPAMGAR